MKTNSSTRQKSILSFLIPLNYLCAAFIVYLVYATGGTPSIYANLILIPVVLTALFTPVWHSVLFAVLSGFAMGPLISILTQDSSKNITWIIRVLVYAIVSVVISYISTRSRERQKHFEFMATHDPLTTLPNYNSIADSRIPSSGALSILMMAFNEDGDIQGLFGSDFYQSIVKNISTKLSELLSSYPNATLYKGTDLNYTIIVHHYSSEESLENILAALNNINDVTITVDKIPVYVSYRIGFTVIRPGASIPEGIRQANIALRYSFLEDQRISRYTEAMRDYYKGTVNIASEFDTAIENGMVKASYQTIHDAVTRKPAGVEILAKWMREDGSRMTAEEFVPILQKTSCLQQLTIFMTQEAIKHAHIPKHKGERFSINFSASELTEKSVMEFVRAIESSDINPDLVMIEIAGAFQEDEYLVRDHLLFLKKHGIRVAMDFFSAAKSPFMLLSDVPLDVIKINREITAAYNQPKGASLIQSIVSFAKANQIKTVAEGVENDFQATYCANAGVDYLQGYFFSVPQLMTVQENEASSSSDESQAGVEYPDISIVPKE
ncbi:MAG: EAL domain-containing protein [Clostridiales bacterium]|nr:EAL domain-containing protein [Clostridiales bacterium]